MAEIFENLETILRDWAKGKVQKSFAEELNRFEKQKEERWSRFFWKVIQKQLSSSLSRQSSGTKPSTKLVLVSWEPLRYLEFNKPDKQNASEIYLFKCLKRSNFPGLKIAVDTLIDARNETSKHHFFTESVKINT